MPPSSSVGSPQPAPLRIRADIRAMHAYPVATATEGFVKLDAMENPYRLPPELQAELGRRLGAVAVNRYPAQQMGQLQAALRHYTQAPEGTGVVLGNGSDELITLLATLVMRTAPQLAAQAADQAAADDAAARTAQRKTGPGAATAAAATASAALRPAKILAPQPSFVFYAIGAQILGLDFIGVPLDDDFQLDEAAMLAAIAQHQPELVYLAWPNNPTGTQWRAATLQRCVDAVGAYGGIVVMDEAYQPFASDTWLAHWRAARAANPGAQRHVVIMRTLSKFGLAGVRLGYLLGDAAITDELEKIRPPYNVSVLNLECALFALAHTDVFAAQAATLRAEREALQTALAALPGVQRVYPSQGNMVLVRLRPAAGHSPAEAAAHACAALRARHVLVKDVSKMHPMLVGCLRLTVGTPEENAQLLAALKDLP